MMKRIYANKKNYKIDVIQRHFWLAAMRAPYLDGAREKPQKNVSKKNYSWENY